MVELPTGPRLAGILLLLVPSATAFAQATFSVSRPYSGGVEDDLSEILSGEAVSQDGRYVVFRSRSTNLVPSDTNGARDIFVRDRLLGVTSRISIGPNGEEADDDSFYACISADARFVAFSSAATNLVPGDLNGHADVFVRNLQTNATVRASVSTSGGESNGDSLPCRTSADGRYVVFASQASNLVSDDFNGVQDIFVRDLSAGTTNRVSLSNLGVEGNGPCTISSISGDGRYVAFTSSADDLVPGDQNGADDVFVRDLQAGTTILVSVDSNGIQGNAESAVVAITPDGRFVVFGSDATNLVPGDTNGCRDVFVRDLVVGTTERVSLRSDGSQGFGDSYADSISPDGRFITFTSFGRYVPTDLNLYADIYLRDRALGTTTRVSLPTFGSEQPNGDAISSSVSADGKLIAFNSGASNLDPPYFGVLVRDLAPLYFTEYCQPEFSLTRPCPCRNPPSDTDRGCDNSAATGGALLAATGISYLSKDYLVFTVSGETPHALSVVMQGTALSPVGFVFGQGVRCVVGTLKRLYTKSATNGYFRAPDYSDPSDVAVSWRSAALGDPIPAGASRYYFVYYRDPIVRPGCPAGSTFNSTASAGIVWYS